MIRIDRRQLIATSAFGLGGLILPGGWATAQALSGARGFTHNVASGEPDRDSVLLWTRFVSDGPSAKVSAEISDTADFVRVVGGGEMITGPWRDWTVKITVDGLMPNRRYFYRFIGPDGAKSPVGRTKTLPAGAVPNFAIGAFSCSNLPVGAFNAYGHAAARDDIDLMLHLGDYFYEYKRGGYPADSPRWDLVMPSTEIFNLADYRLRYQSYRADPDLQAIHNRHPMLVSRDDHEAANDSWEGGAENHQADEGDWNARRSAALQAYREWMPVDDLPYKAYDLGGLGTLFRTETRLLARSKPSEVAPLFAAMDVPAELAKFKAGEWRDPAKTMMGSTQESWLSHGLKASVAARKAWQIVGVGTIVGETFAPPEALSWLTPDSDPRARRYAQAGTALTKAGIPFNMDNWSGYPAARARMLKAAQAAKANLVVLSGDSHNAWAYDLKNEGKRAGVEFAGHAVSSPGYESSLKTDPATVAAAFVRASPELKWCDTSRRGYMRLALTPASATNEWVFMQTLETRSLATQASHRMRVRPGAATLETVTA
jgi:alkaline phosphatase D